MSLDECFLVVCDLTVMDSEMWFRAFCAPASSWRMLCTYQDPHYWWFWGKIKAPMYRCPACMRRMLWRGIITDKFKARWCKGLGLALRVPADCCYLSSSLFPIASLMVNHLSSAGLEEKIRQHNCRYIWQWATDSSFLSRESLQMACVLDGSLHHTEKLSWCNFEVRLFLWPIHSSGFPPVWLVQDSPVAGKGWSLTFPLTHLTRSLFCLSLAACFYKTSRSIIMVGNS